ncbi:hypothetical protein EDD85DRAFT_348863 [Armillaria nabsnona]|nr:hypothetical protein EDD85DRAFT_348863 [Armillaria nabsnona]
MRAPCCWSGVIFSGCCWVLHYIPSYHRSFSSFRGVLFDGKNCNSKGWKALANLMQMYGRVNGTLDISIPKFHRDLIIANAFIYPSVDAIAIILGIQNSYKFTST